ncbi:endonuclease MutS2 [Candidatus Formimonas warabiya]|uniref:DNA mismatch repair proteins mutS family domain-containing protein n=1 Tax=Formimonas warabiya TaxID=1761012 RepID=A0A3G1KWW5_FORW1|nr:endonuclease MutS2 [Candidatus Formimonas warabiya]ATW26887.1 hypothetical protein DCMF_20865 [Candidatus Formimonas warabiya]
MNQTTIHLLEYDKIKERLGEFAVSELGKKMVARLEPSLDIRVIENSLRETTEAKALVNLSSSIPLHSLTGIPGILEKLSKGFVLEGEELTALAGFLKDGRRLKRFMKERTYAAPVVSSYAFSISELDDLREEIEECIRNGVVDDQASAELAKIRRKISGAEGRIKSKLDSMVKSPQYKTYLQDSLVGFKNGRYVLPVKSEYRKNVKGSVVDCSASGSTVFIEPEEIGRLHQELGLLKVLEEKEVYRILAELAGWAASCHREISVNMEVMAQYDFAFAKAKYSRVIEGNPVAFNQRNYLRLKGARHPLIGRTAVPLDFTIGTDYRAFIITGPNTGGKTVALKAIGLLTMMAQSGLHVSVEEGSEFALFADVLADVGDGQSIEQSLSSFSAHIKNIKSIIECADTRTLVLLDELGAGTDPGEGMGLAVSLLETLYDQGATIIATTHYSEIKNFAREKTGFENGCMEFDLNTLQPLFKLKIGEPGQSNAFLIALRLGMDRRIIERAHEVTYQEKRLYLEQPTDAVCELPKEREIRESHQVQLARVEEIKEVVKKGEKQKIRPGFQIGDAVLVKTFGKLGIVYELENSKGEVGVMVQDKKMKINKKRLSLHIEAKELYPENYDMDIVFESKENRKKRHLMSRKYQKGLMIKVDPDPAGKTR